MRSVARRLLPCLALVVLIALVAAWWVPAAPFARFRGVANDPIFPRGQIDDTLLIVAIDEPAIAHVSGGWPWSRTVLGELVTRLDDAGAKVIVLDLLLADARPDDATLVEAMESAGNVVVAAAPVDAQRGGDEGPLRTADLVRPVPAIAAAAAAVGSSIALPDDADGVLRRSPMVIEGPDLRLVPGLALAATAVAARTDPTPILRRPSGVQVGARAFPTDDLYRLRVSWPEGLRGGDAVISAADVLRGRGASRVANKIVYVGATAPSLGDRWNTPIDRVGGTPGVATHVAVHHTLASREFLEPASTRESILWMVVLAVALVLATRFLPLWLAAFVDIAVVVGAVVGAFARSNSGVVVDIVDLALVPLLAVPLAGAVRYVTETRLRRRVSDLFARYVPEQVARELVREGRVNEAADGQRLSATVFFCDLRGFTPLAAKLTPLEVKRLLTEYYEHVTERVLQHGGTVVQYVGDEVFAVFGAPLPFPDHAERAIAAAIEVQAERDELDRTLHEMDMPSISFGVSIHSGEIVAAHAGSARRRQYAVIGDPVNVGSRLCGQAGDGEVVVSDEARVAGGGAELEGRFEPELKGVDRSVVAWRVAPATGLGRAG